jgi:hypothetical protein
MTPKEWSSFLEFFELPQDIPVRCRLHFPGFKSQIAAYQLLTSWWLVMQDGYASTARGAYLADKMGFGKTIEVFAYYLLCYWINTAQLEVADAHRRGLSDHNGPQVLKGTACPYRRQHNLSKWPFACPCEQGITAELNLLRGPSLLLVTSGLVGNWRDEWVKHIDQNCSKCPMRLLIQGIKTPKDIKEVERFNQNNIFVFEEGKHISELTSSYVDSAGEMHYEPVGGQYHTVVIMSKTLAKKLLHGPEGTMFDICWSKNLHR